MSKQAIIPEPTHTLLNRSGIIIETDDRNMVCFFSYSPNSAVPELKVPIIKAALKKAGVVFGIDENAIERLSGVNKETKQVILARALEPRFQDEPQVKYNFPVDPYAFAKANADKGKVDHRNRGKLPFVRKGEVVASIVHRIPPEPGISILGEDIPPVLSKTAVRQPGNNVELVKDQYIALIDGGPRMDAEGRISVQAVWHIDGDVEIKTGNIYFDGPVRVKGVIQPGFEVRAKSLQVDGIENRTAVEVEGDLEITGGIQGGTIKVGGTLVTRYINNAEVLVVKDVDVRLSIVNSDVKTSGYLSAQTIFGGTITARKGVSVANLSSEANRTTVIFGVDPIKQKNISDIVRQKIEVEEKLHQIREKIGPILIDYEKLNVREEKIKNVQTEREALVQRMQSVKPDDEASLEFFQERLKEIDEEISPIVAEIAELKRATAGISTKYLNELLEIKQLTALLQKLEAEQEEMADEMDDLEIVPKVQVRGKALAGTRISSSRARMLLKKDLPRVVFTQRRQVDPKKRVSPGREYFMSVERL